MQAKRKITARKIVNDIRSGLSNLELMEKYKLSSKGLLSAFNKLISTQTVEEQELAGRIPLLDDTIDIDHAREFPRCYPALGLPIYDEKASEAEYHVVDVTEKGVQVVGMAARVGDLKTLIIKAGGLDERIKPCTFDAECRWVKADPKKGNSVAGFEITYISDKDLEVLLHIIQLLTFCDE
jgi:PilZ domain